MTRPDEIAALADRLGRECQVREADTDNYCPELTAMFRECEAALRLSATSPGDAVRDIVIAAADELYTAFVNHAKTAYQNECIAEYADARNSLTALAPAEKAGDVPTTFYSVLNKAGVEYSAYSCGGVNLFGDKGSISKAVDAFHSHSQIDDLKTQIRHWRDECGKLHSKAATPTPPRADGLTLPQLIEHHLDINTFEKNDDGSIVIDRAGMILTMSEDERFIQSAAPGGGTEGGPSREDARKTAIANDHAEYGDYELNQSDGGVEGHADPSSGRSSRASHLSRELEEAGIKPGPSDTVDCPDCRGSGSRAISVAGCCENPTRTGECCGNAIEVPSYEECSSCGGSGMVPGPSDPAQEPQAVAPFGYLFAKAGENNGYYFVSPREFSTVESRFQHIYTPVYTRPALDREAVKRAVHTLLHGPEGCDWPINRTYDDAGLSEEGYVEFIMEILALIEGRM